jgi:hypothetical protein
MRHGDVIKAAQQIGVAPGETVTIQSAQEINNPHWHHDQSHLEPQHVDAYAVTNNAGNLSVQKFHGQ